MTQYIKALKKALSYLITKIGENVGLKQNSLLIKASQYLAVGSEPGLEVRKIPIRQLGLRTTGGKFTVHVRRG